MSVFFDSNFPEHILPIKASQYPLVATDSRDNNHKKMKT